MKKYEYHDVNMRGTIEKLKYTTTNRDGELREKYTHIYLPYGYESEDKEKKYNILYLMHGGGGNPDAWLDFSKLKNMFDYLIDTGEIKPLIVVFPTYYKEKIARIGEPDAELERSNVMFFQSELVDELLPSVENVYNTYAGGSTKEDFKASRLHRGFGGFSMGSCTTWFVLLNHLDYFSEFIPLSGDCWAVEVKGGQSQPVETVKALCDSIIKSGYSKDEFRIHTATGTLDGAMEPLNSQVDEMKKHTDIFAYSEDFGKGNLHYLLAEGEVHSYEAVMEYLYNFLGFLFQ